MAFDRAAFYETALKNFSTFYNNEIVAQMVKGDLLIISSTFTDYIAYIKQSMAKNFYYFWKYYDKYFKTDDDLERVEYRASAEVRENSFYAVF